MGRLTPVFISECVPGDTFHGSSEILIRVAPLRSPIYDAMQLFVHFFFVPWRILYEDWEEFITGGRLGVGVDPLVAPILPYEDIGGILDNTTLIGKSTQLDYLGVPILPDLPGYVNPAQYSGINLNMGPSLAYSKIYMDWYRDRNYVADDLLEFPVPSGDMTGNGYDYMQLRTRAYHHDYFTSALPFTQRGVEVLMPLAGTGSVTYLDSSRMMKSDGVTPSAAGAIDFDSVLPGPETHLMDSASDDVQIQNIDEVTLTASSVSINDFRAAYALQVWVERNAVGGSRYDESTQAHFGVRPQDSRLQYAEFLGGGRVQIQIQEVVSTAYSDDGEAIIPLANLAGKGTGYGNTNRFTYFCPEHGFLIGIASIMNNPSYHQGMPRMFTRETFLDYPWPTFAKLGEQQVDKSELFASAANLTQNSAGVRPLFGYQSRYADWKCIHSSNHGDFHDTLLFWTLTREFATSPELGNGFVEFDDATQDRIFVVNGDADNFWLLVHNNVTVRRALPYFSTPNTLNFA